MSKGRGLNPRPASSCPNCGQELYVEQEVERLTCPSCHENLFRNAEGKFLLVRPISTYLDAPASNTASGRTMERDQRTESALQEIENRRRKVSAELTYQRITQQVAVGERTLKAGLIIVVAGILFLTIAIPRLLLIDRDPLSLIALAVVLTALLPIGVYLLAWSMKTRHSSLRILRAIREELVALQEQEPTLK